MVNEIIEDVSVNTRANVYFDGRVISRTCYRKDDSRFTLGVITAGIFLFDVGAAESVYLLSGEAEILLPGESEWRKVAAPESFSVSADSQYQIRTPGIVEYFCEYDDKGGW